MANESSGIFVSGNVSVAGNSFPKEFKRGLFSSLDRRFTLIFSICAVIILGTVFVLSLLKTTDKVSEKEILKIQERYARLVLNQPKPEVKKVEEVNTSAGKAETGRTEGKEEAAGKPKVERDKETFVEKQKRRETGVAERRQVREQVARQIQSSGIFAAITAAGNSGGSGGSESDLLGNVVSGGTGDLSNLAVSSGSFAKKSDVGGELSAKKGTAYSGGVGIEKQALGHAEVAQVASTGSVNITSQPPEVTGDAVATNSDRSQAAIARVVNRETQRLKRVYEDWLKRDPALNGSLTVKFVILPSGAVSNVSVVKSSTNNSEFDETIVRYIKRWQFPPVPESGPVEVVYPFAFEGQS